jgi:hypothetical protein
MTEAHLQTFRFPELKRHAILLSLGEDPSSTTQVDVDTYKVAFVYTDVDGDKAMIASDSDLEEAILQFNKKGSVKVFASVEQNKDKKAPSRESATTQTVHSAADSTTQTVHSSSTASSSSSTTHTARGSVMNFASSSANAAASRRSHKGPKPLQEVVESFVNAIATAVITVADQIQPPPNTATQANTTPADTTPAPFIHGRHTCDGCLTTPIVGTRFQAVNLPDYDLCAQCKDNYKGSEIKFQAVELDRDRPFQERWQRRQAKMASGRPVRNGGCRHQRNPRANGPNRVRRCGGGRFASQQPTQGPPVDIAVAEAIRRSLEDAKKAEEKKKQADAVTQTLETVVHQEEKATQSDGCAETVTTEETACDLLLEEEEQARKSDEQESDDETTSSMPNLMAGKSVEQESDDETTDSMPNLLAAKGYHDFDSMPSLLAAKGCQLYAPKVSPVKSTEETACEEKQAEVANEPESDDETDDSMPRLSPRVDPNVSPVKTTEETACEDSDEEESDEESADFGHKLVMKERPHVAPERTSVPKEVEIVNKGDADSSFASDAEGSGEIAAVLGETLDRVARAIDDMHLEFDRTMEKEIVVEAVEDQKGNDEDESSDTSQSAQDDDCDSWNMVADDDN